MKTVLEHPFFRQVIQDNPHYHLPSLTDAYAVGSIIYYTDLIRLGIEGYKGGPLNLTSQCTKIRIDGCDGEMVHYQIIEDARLARGMFTQETLAQILGAIHSVKLATFLGLSDPTAIFFFRPRTLTPDGQQNG